MESSENPQIADMLATKENRRGRVFLTYTGDNKDGELPEEVAEVLKGIHKCMLATPKGRVRDNMIADVPNHFYYSALTGLEKDAIMDVAGRQYEECNCYKVVVPLPIQKLEDNVFSWAGFHISFENSSEKGTVVVKVKSDARVLSKKFINGPLIRSCGRGYLLSSYRMTISWLRSSLHKAITAYLKKDQTEIMPTIIQKEKRPFFLHLKKETEEKPESLFLFHIAFRLSPCFAAVPTFCCNPLKLDTENDEYSWKTVQFCQKKHDHDQMATIAETATMPGPRVENNEEKKKLTKNILPEKGAMKLSAEQERHCESCGDPVSRSLLQYYYQYGHISEERMKKTKDFVEGIISFLVAHSRKICKKGDPKVKEYMLSGSVAENLKVVSPNEFDIMIVIDLPGCYSFHRELLFPTGFAICRVKRSKTFSRGLRRCITKLGHCLEPGRFASWLFGKLQRGINAYDKEFDNQAKLKLRQQRPSSVLEITPSDALVAAGIPQLISVDLVLVLKYGDEDNRYAVAKPANVEQFIRKVIRMRSEKKTEVEGESQTKPAQENLKLLWRISYSSQEKQYLDYVAGKQAEQNVEGCQNICLKILKTIWEREILRRDDEYRFCQDVPSYILKTALFHVLSQSDWFSDWGIEQLADRYEGLLKKLEPWESLPHFFFNNKVKLDDVFPEEKWRNETESIDLLEKLHDWTKGRVKQRFLQISSGFFEFKEKMAGKGEESDQGTSSTSSYENLLQSVLDTNKSVEDFIHPRFVKSATKRNAHENEKNEEDQRIRMAAKRARKTGATTSVEENVRIAYQNTRPTRPEATRDDDDYEIVQYIVECSEYDYYMMYG